MTKAELIQAISDHTGQAPGDIEAIIDSSFALIAMQMVSGGSVSIHGFGTFGIRTTVPRRRRTESGDLAWNPSSQRLPHFRPSPALASKIAG